jgi:hypothetical protein
VQLDSITSNELGDPGALVAVAGRPDIAALAEWQSQSNLGATASALISLETTKASRHPTVHTCQAAPTAPPAAAGRLVSCACTLLPRTLEADWCQQISTATDSLLMHVCSAAEPVI